MMRPIMMRYSPWMVCAVALLGGCSDKTPAAGRYSDPDKPVIDFAQEYCLEKLPLQVQAAGNGYSIKIMAKEALPEVFQSVRNEYEKAFKILRNYFPLKQKVEITCRIVVTDRLPENYRDAPQRKSGKARDHLLILSGGRDQWESEILSDTASETHEWGHALGASKHPVAWFEEGFCEELRYQYLVGSQPQRADAERKEWTNLKDDRDLRRDIWTFEPWNEILKIEKAMKGMKGEKASKEKITAFYKGSWSAFDKRYRYSWGIVRSMMEFYGPEIFAEILRRYHAGRMEAAELQGLALRAMAGK